MVKPVFQAWKFQGISRNSKSMTNAERKRLWRLRNPAKHQAELERRRIGKNLKRRADTAKAREDDKARKAKSRNSQSWQKNRSVRMREASQKREHWAAVNVDSISTSTPHVQETMQREKVKLKFNNSKYHNKSISPLIAAKLNTLKGSRTVEANVARRALINTYGSTNTSHTRRGFQCKFGVRLSQLQKSLNNNDIQVYIGHTKKHNGSHFSTSANT